MRYEIVFSGSGGQGMILSGIITAEAAALCEKMYAVQTQSYGPEARGGMTESYVILSPTEPIDYPEITEADVLVALSQPGLERQLKHIKSNAAVIVDSKNVKVDAFQNCRIYAVPATDISVEIMQRPISANIVALGALCALAQKIKSSSFETIIARRVPKDSVEKNLECFRAGYKYMVELLQKAPIEI